MTHAIELLEVKRRFGKVQALGGLSLTVQRGEVYGFLGRNGAGKTTTLRILMGIVKADAGEIRLLGESVKRVGVSLKQRIGHVSQEQSFYPWMTANDLGRFVAGLYPTWDGAEFLRLLQRLDVPKDRRTAELSGGTRTKLALALALAPRPQLLLLDEPTTGLDPVARAEFNDLVRDTVLQHGTTAFFSSHLVDEVEPIANRVGILQNGKMLFEGPVRQLLAEVRRVVLPPPAPPAPAEISVSEVLDEPTRPTLGDVVAATANVILSGSDAPRRVPSFGEITGATPFSFSPSEEPVPDAPRPPTQAPFSFTADDAVPTNTFPQVNAPVVATTQAPLMSASRLPPVGESLKPPAPVQRTATPAQFAATPPPLPFGAVSPTSALAPSSLTATPNAPPSSFGAAASAPPAPRLSVSGVTAPSNHPAVPPAPSIAGVSPPPPSFGAAPTPSVELLIPNGFTRVRGDVWRAPEEAWAKPHWPPGTMVQSLDLAAVFLAMARTDA